MDKSELLGENFSTASGKLRKLILFELAQMTNRDLCFRCNDWIDTVDDFTIEHKIAWMASENPKEAFFDLNNIAFSHKKCNIRGSKETCTKGHFDFYFSNGRRYCRECDRIKHTTPATLKRRRERYQEKKRSEV